MKSVGALMFQNEMLRSGLKPHIETYRATDYSGEEEEEDVTFYRVLARYRGFDYQSESRSILDAYDDVMMHMSRYGRINYSGEDINSHGIVDFVNPDGLGNGK